MDPVKYNQAHQVIIDEFKKSASNHRFWMEEQVASIRAHVKTHYIAQQKYSCCYCQQENLSANHAVWDVEHVIPKKTHPTFMFTELNLSVACKDCNVSKRNQNVLVNKNRKRFPTKPANYMIAHPHFDNWDDHLRIVDEYIYVPKTNKGKMTIIICNLMRFAIQFASLPGDEDRRFEKDVTAIMRNKRGANRKAALANLLGVIK